ncbi:hypothetical protein DFH11DRAFT_1251664 [Phellopilus nigrolimitatus]|nr:hypothetical protein DFH11DRAFT_1251664 [Phellopilus nigrolimitatus]
MHTAHISANVAMHAAVIPRDLCVAFLALYLGVQNAMARKVFRDVKIGVNEPPPSSSTTLSGVVVRYGDLLDSRMRKSCTSKWNLHAPFRRLSDIN